MSVSMSMCMCNFYFQFVMECAYFDFALRSSAYGFTALRFACVLSWCLG